MFGNFVPVPIETFGGLCDTVDRNDLPPWMAREAKNCLWKPGSVEKRPGFAEWYTAAAYSIRGIFTFATKGTSSGLVPNPTGRYLMEVDSNGLIHGRTAGGTPAFVDGTTPVMAGGPVLPSAIQSYASWVLGFSDGNRSAGFGGTVSMLPTDGTLYPAWVPLFIEAPPTALTLAVLTGGGSMTAGAHTAWATFEMLDGAMSPPTPPASVTVASNDRMTLSFPGVGWYSGVLGIAAIHLWVSPAGDTQNGYFVARVAVNGLPYTFSLSDGVLTTAEKLDKAALSRTAAPLLPAAVVGPYKGRTCYIGSPHRYYPGPTAETRTRNTSFFYEAGAGWAAPATGGAFTGGLGCYQITFDGVSGVRGLLTNTGTVVSDLAGRASVGATAFSLASWGVRVLARKTAGLTNASLRLGMSATVGAWAEEVSADDIGTTWTLIERIAIGTSWGNDGKLFVQGVGPGVNGQKFEVALVEAFDPTSRWAAETVWWSRPGLPREVDMTWGPVTIANGQGQTVRYGFEMGDRFYYVTDRSVWVTQDNGGEPAQWPVELVADGIGTPSFNGVGEGSDWKAIAGPEGLWLFTGGTVTEDANLAREIKGLWGRIAWAQFGHLVTVRVMHSLRQIWVGAPLDDAPVVSHLLVLDFSEGFTSGLTSGGVGRRWSVWTIAPTGAPLEFLDAAGERRALLPVGTKTLSLEAGTYADAGAGYAFAWESGPVGPEEGGLGLFRKLMFSAEGYGLLTPALVRAGGQLRALISQTLFSPRRGDYALLFSLSDERVGLRFEQAATAGAWVRIARAALSWVRRPFMGRRPYNP